MKDIKQYIDKVLGSSIRCLLPSYWWKRIFGLIVDEVEGKASKASVATLEKKVESFKGGGVQAITIYPLERSTKQSYHRRVYDTIVELAAKGEDFIVYAEVGTSIYPATTILANPLSAPSYGFGFQGWVLTEIHQDSKTEKEYYEVILFADGTMQLYTVQDYVIDHVISKTSTNAVQNKVITAELAKKQDALVSGKTIKTINGQSIIGEGDITIEADSNITVDSSLSSTSTNPLQNKVVTAELNKINNAIKNGAGAISINVDTTAGTWSQASDSVTQDKYLHESDYKGYELRINGVKRGFIGGIENTSYNGIPSSYIRWTEIIPQQALFSKSWINITFENYILRLGNDGKTKGFTKYVTKITNNEISKSGVDESLRFDFAEYDLISGEENLITNRTRNYTIPKELLDNVETLVALARSSSSLLTKSSIKTLNGVSLVGDGNLQLGDGQTIVYDDSQVQTRLTSLETTSDDIYDEIDAIWDEVDGILDDMSLDYKDFSNALDDLTDETNELIARVDDMEADNKMMDSFLSQGFYTMPLRKIFAITLYPGFVITDFTANSLALIIEEGGTQYVYKEDLPYVVQKKIIGNDAAFNDETISFQSANYAKLLALESQLSALGSQNA